nr:ribonuclease J [Pasteuria penetrans]
MRNQRGKLQIFALGGLDEIGKNMYVIQYKQDMVVVDAGLMFPDEGMLGIDIVIPDVSYLIENRDKLRAIVLTHGHEDHIGGLPYILRQIRVPIYATKLTMGLVEHKLREAHMLHKVRRVVVDTNSEVHLGTSLKVSFFATSHSIPDSVGVCVDTPEGKVVHTGDFRFDMTPIHGEPADLHKMAAIGQAGVLCLLSDSTNAERPGFTGSERTVAEGLKGVFRCSKQRIIVATFASNIHRIQGVVNASLAYGRKLAVVGRSMVNVVQIASELGYLKIPDDLLIELEEVNRLPAHRVAIISTGSQGEPMSALTRMANASHRKVEILPGDTVVIAATPIPGNEKLIGRTVDQLFRIGAEVVYSANAHVHISGHGAQEDLKLMLSLLKPKYFMPIHGEYRMLCAHARLAESVGVCPENVFVCDNGDMVEIVEGKARFGPKVATGKVLIDGLGVGDVGNIVLRDRKLLSQDGIIVIVVTLSKSNRAILSGPDIISRGFVYVRESEQLLEEATGVVVQAMQKCMKEQISEWTFFKTSIRDSLGKFLFERTRRRPMILPIIMEV